MAFINFSNHPSALWGERQREAAGEWGEIQDIPFPQVGAEAGEEEIHALACRCAEEILRLKPDAVMCQGEFTLCYEVVSLLTQRGIQVVAACSRRETVECRREDGSSEKRAAFVFARFRAYHSPVS